MDETLAKGLKKDKRGFSLVWIAPILALIITSGMLYKTYTNAGTRITIIVDTGDGIQDKKTPIMYKGIKIGVVDDIHIHANDVSKLELEAIIDKEAAWGVTREGNKFWIVKPKVSLTEVSGLDTIISGVYIAVMPARNTKEELYNLPFKDTFVALDSAPVNVFDPGLAIRVNTVNKGDIAIGAPVLYNKQAIGKVEDKRLTADRSSIDLFLRIDSKYADLIHDKSVFYKADALEVKASLSGIKVNMGSFASFIAGGIALHNTKEAFSSPLAKANEKFVLFDNYNEVMLDSDEIILKMSENNSVYAGLTKVYYKGVEAGVVKSIDYDVKEDVSRVKIKLHTDFRALANAKAYFWIVKAQLGFDKIEGLDTVLRGCYINFISEDTQAKKQDEFILHQEKPAPLGKHIKLWTKDIKSLKKNAGVFYHNIEIGRVNTYEINADKRSFSLDVVIEPRYTRLLNASSRFYHNSGVSFKASLDKVAISTGSLETMLRGGISVETPRFKNIKGIKTKYPLYDSRDAMQKAGYLAAKGLYLTLEADRAGSIKEGSSVLYKQIKVGEVLSAKWNSQKQKLMLEVFIIQKYAKEVHENTLFYNASGVHAKIDLNGLNIETESIETIISGGISFFTPSKSALKVAKSHDTYTLYQTKEKAMKSFFTIRLLAQSSAGLKIGSAVKYKEVSIGYVDSIDLLKTEVELVVLVDAKYKELVNAHTIFWIEGFELGLKGVKNPSAAFTGPTITLKPGESKQERTCFNLKLQAPIPHFKEKGLRVNLSGDRLGGIKPNTPLYFRQVEIGSVVQYHLKPDATGVDIEVFVQPCYAHLIRKNSYFFNASGIGMDLSLFGAKVKTESIESIITGGIGVLTPDDFEEEALNKDNFILHESFDEEALEWKPELISKKENCH